MIKLTKYAVLYRPRKIVEKKIGGKVHTFEQREVNGKERIVKQPQGYSDCCCAEIEDSYYIFDTKKEALSHLTDYHIYEADLPRVVKITITY